MTRIAAGVADLPDPPRGQHWVFHRGALGDAVLLWPMLRHWRGRGVDVVLVTDRSKGALAEQEVGIRAEDAETPRFNRLWVANAEVEPVSHVQGVVVYLGPEDEGLRTWRANAHRMFPGATFSFRSERPDRSHALRYSLPALNHRDARAIVMHIGAGSESKRWPLSCWLALAESISGIRREPGDPRLGPAAGVVETVPTGPQWVRLIAGEVERERLSAADQRSFAQAGGEFLFNLGDLAAAIRSARVFVAADSGPGHLAAQLGVPTISLFGPTDPGQWSPVGPAVRVLAPPSARSMDWLNPPEVMAAIGDMVRSVYGKSG